MREALTVLLDTDDLATVEELAPQALRGVVLAFDVDLHLALRDRGLEHITAWDVVRGAKRAPLAAADELRVCAGKYRTRGPAPAPRQIS